MNSREHLVVGVGRAFCLLAVLLAGCNISIGPSLRGSGVSKMETREVAPLSEIEVGSAVQLDVTVGDPTSLVVTADDNILPLVRTEVVGDRLKIYVDGSTSTDIGVQVKATTPDLTALLGSGAARITATGVTGERFQLELNGASICELSSNADSIDANLSGACRGQISGAAKQFTIECSGASHVDATGLTAEKIDAECGGASTAQLNATQELSAAASGASHLRYAGNPAKLNKQVSGASTVSAE